MHVEGFGYGMRQLEDVKVWRSGISVIEVMTNECTYVGVDAWVGCGWICSALFKDKVSVFAVADGAERETRYGGYSFSLLGKRYGDG